MRGSPESAVTCASEPSVGSQALVSSSHRPSVPDRKTTRLNSSHVEISYAVFCLKKKRRPRRSAEGGATRPTGNPYGRAPPRFFLLIRRPPRSTLFPYTTLGRAATARRP